MSKKIVFLILSIVLIIAMISGVFIQRHFALANSENQVNVLKEIFRSNIDLNQKVTLSDSALTNFITKKEYSLQHKEELLAATQKNELNTEYIIYIKYNKDNKILVVTKSDIENTYRYIQKYKLNVKNWKIVYEIYGDVIEERTFN